MPFTDRVISLPPAIITILFVLLFAGAGVAINIFPFASPLQMDVFAIAMMLLLGPLMLWHYCLYRAASDHNAEVVGHGGHRGFLFLLTVGGYSANLALIPFTMGTQASGHVPQPLFAAYAISIIVGAVSYFAAIWASSNALVRFDDRTKSAEFHKTLGTFILELYLPIGIWVIYPRIKRLLAEPEPLVR
jgi:hypothetical protein